jgi:hypothetical protein
MKTQLQKGIKKEEFVIQELKKEFSEDKDVEIIHHKTWGSDIEFKNGARYFIEVKSAEAYIWQKCKGQSSYWRQGTFFICPHQVSLPAFFAFVIDYNDHNQLYYVAAEMVKSFLSSRKKPVTRYSITIPQMKKFLKPKSRFKYFIKKHEEEKKRNGK